MSKPHDYALNNATAFIESLKAWLKVPSISTEAQHKDDVKQAATWLRDHCQALGFTRAEIYETAGHPIVYAEWLGAGDAAPTVLVYGHYDVQPVDDPRNEWQTLPFEPTERNGNLYARGATDDKGQTFIHLKAFESFMQAQGSFPVNLKLLIEGEEEIGSTHLKPFVRDHAEMLRADVVVISDTGILSPEQPSIVYGLRGNVYMELEVFGPKSDLHSGMFGGVVHNPAQALAAILAQLHTPDGVVSVPGFYDNVQALSEKEKIALAQVPYPLESLQAETGVPDSWGDPAYSIRERVGTRPTLEICGIVGGWTGQGAKTVIPAQALAKISCRLVPDQDPARIYQLLQQHIADITPPTVRSELRLIHAGTRAAVMPIDSDWMQKASDAYSAVFEKAPVFLREGGSIPVVSTFQEQLDVPVLLMGFGLPDDNLHAPNEKITLSMFHRGVQTMLHFYDGLAQG